MKGATASASAILRLIAFMAVLVVIAEAVGTVPLPLGSVKIALLPLLWALLLGIGWGLAGRRMPRGLRLSTDLQTLAGNLLQSALMLFVVKLGLMVGANVPRVLQAGWALVFQEFGHFLGTMVFGLPIALLLGIKREAIGATFSVGREPSLAIIAERFGMNSPEGRGVLAEYLTGTIFGAVFIALLAGVIASFHIFDPRALAMGAGIGSGSMMAAAAGAIAAQTPAMAQDIAAFAAASNMITTTIGTYFTLFISLPFTIWAYGVLEPVLGRRHANRETAESSVSGSDSHELNPHEVSIVPLPVWAVPACWCGAGALALLGNWRGHGVAPTGTVVLGMAIIILATALASLLQIVTGRRLPTVLWCSLLGMACTYPAMPWAHAVATLTDPINFLALTTPMLAFAGLSVAKDIPAFRALGWRIVVTSFCANAGTFLGAVSIAQFFTHHRI